MCMHGSREARYVAHAQAPYSLILWQNGNFLHRLTDSPAGVTWITDIVACLQIQTSRQRAIMLVHAYPFVTHKDKLVSVLAEQHGEPSVQSLLSDITKTDLQHAADWQQAVDYLNTITVAAMHLHQPLL